MHRDLKRQNVMIARDAEGHETPKLLDFGIAKAVESDGATLTSTGMVLGTPRYLSPEQARGLSVDGRSDLYSLGIMFYEMLVGRVHDFDKDLSCRKEWVESALHSIFKICDTFNIESLGLQLLGTRYGPIEDKWFIERLRVILAETTNSQLINIWIMIPDHCAPDKISDRISLSKLGTMQS